MPDLQAEYQGWLQNRPSGLRRTTPDPTFDSWKGMFYPDLGAAGPSSDTVLPDVVVTPENRLSAGGWSQIDPRGMIPHIKAAALKYGVDPVVAIRVARSEGLGKFLGDSGKSGGAFQLYTGGGLGNEFQKETGLDPLNPDNEPATIDWAIKNLARTGWGPYHGAKLVGVGGRDGIGGSQLGLDSGGVPELRMESNKLVPKKDDSWIPSQPAPTPQTPWQKLLALSALSQGAQIQPVQVKYDPRIGAHPVAVPESVRGMLPGLGNLPQGMRIERQPGGGGGDPAGGPIGNSEIPISPRRASSPRQDVPSMTSPVNYVTRLGMRPYYSE